MLNALNAEQQCAAQAPDGPQLILAGAGSGKTRTIIHRIGHLISARGIAPHRILAVTFTNKAAHELKTRLHQLIGDGGGGVVSGTFHSISLRFLRQYAETLGYPRSFQVIDSDDQKAWVKRLLKQQNLDRDRLHPSYLLHWIEHCKHAGLSVRDAPDHEKWNGVNMHRLYTAYQAELMRLERMDFSDLILNALELLRHHDDVAALMRSRFDHVLVDEYQDTNPAQHQWLTLLCKEHQNLTVVGDDDQSIYGWRGADVQHILTFGQVWPNAKIHKLEKNYRSTQSILTLANAVIQDNTQRHEKHLQTTREAGHIPEWKVCNDEYDEARYVARYLKAYHAQGVSWSDMAILYRANRQSLAFEQMLRETKIPYRVVGGVSFFARMEIKDALAYWCLLHHCADGLHLLRICNTPKRGIGAKGQEAIAAMLGASGLRAADWLDQAAEGVPAPAAKLMPLARLIMDQRKDAMNQPDMGLGTLLEACGYMDSLKARGELEFASRMENIQALQGFIEVSHLDGLTPVEFMDRAALLQSGEELRDDEQAISLMSLHRAKGLEFDTVVLAGVEEGLLPHQRALDEGKAGIAEERRLFYVGITRAKNNLLLTSARMRRGFNETHYPLVSEFIKALPDTVLQRFDQVRVETTPQPSGGIQPGIDVRHPTFGEGTILSLEGTGDAVRVSVQFRRNGIKRLMLKYAALEVLS